MAFFEWDDKKLSLGVVAMDNQHKNLVKIVNRFYDASQQPPNKAANGKLLGELIQYTVTHFTEEEKYMESIKYPGLTEHKFQHKGLVTRALEVKKAFEAGTGAIDQEVLNFLKSWLMTHIQGHDMKYSQYVGATKKAA